MSFILGIISGIVVLSLFCYITFTTHLGRIIFIGASIACHLYNKSKSFGVVLPIMLNYGLDEAPFVLDYSEYMLEVVFFALPFIGIFYGIVELATLGEYIPILGKIVMFFFVIFICVALIFIGNVAGVPAAIYIFLQMIKAFFRNNK